MRERDHQQFLDFICIIELKNNVWHIPNEELWLFGTSFWIENIPKKIRNEILPNLPVFGRKVKKKKKEEKYLLVYFNLYT